jgi:tetratricopeptide (TPR) repeat protein
MFAHKNAWLGLALALLTAPLAAGPDLAAFERKAEMAPKDPQAQFNLGVVAFQAKNLDVAKKAMAKAVKLSPKDAEAWELYGTVLAARQEDAEALSALKQATDLDSKRAKAWMLEGKLLASSEDPKALAEAAEAYAHATKAAPSDGRAWLNQGLVLARLGKDGKAQEALEKALHLKGGEGAQRSLCVLYSKQGDTKRALSTCEAAAKADGRAEDWYNLSFAQQKQGKAVEARKSLQAALKADPEHAPSLYSLAFMDFEAGNAEKALAGFQAALKARKGDYPEAQYNAAVLLGDLGRYEEAADLYRELLKKEPSNEDAKTNLNYVVETGVGSLIDQGKDAYERGDFEAAGKAWKRAAKLDPSNDQVKSLLAKATAKTSAADKAAAAAKKAASQAVAQKLKAEDQKVLKQGLAALKAAKYGEAMRLLDFYLKKNPGDKGAQTALFKARAQVRQKTDELLQAAARELVAGDREKTKALASEALAMDPGNTRARKLLEQSGQAPAAPVNADAVRKLYYAGVEQYLAGDLAGAVETWKKVLAQDANHLDANRSLARAQLELAALKKRGK